MTPLFEKVLGIHSVEEMEFCISPVQQQVFRDRSVDYGSENDPYGNTTNSDPISKNNYLGRLLGALLPLDRGRRL